MKDIRDTISSAISVSYRHERNHIYPSFSTSLFYMTQMDIDFAEKCHEKLRHISAERLCKVSKAYLSVPRFSMAAINDMQCTECPI